MTLHTEIFEQSDILENLLAGQMSRVREIPAVIRELSPPYVFLAARRTSDNAGRYANYLWGSLNRLPVALATPSLFTFYQNAVKEGTGRDLTLGGDITLQIGFTPALVVEAVSFQNATWGSQPNLATIKRYEIKVRLLPPLSRRVEVKRLILIEPEILFERDISGSSNLAFEITNKQDLMKEKDETKDGGDWTLSALTFRELQIEKGRITYIDHELKKKYGATVDTLMATATSSTSPTRLKLKGAYNDTSFEVTGNVLPPDSLHQP